MSSILEHSAVFRRLAHDPIYDEIKEVTPDKVLKDMCMMEVQGYTFPVLQKIGYAPKGDIHDAIDKAWAKSQADDHLCDFIYKVWRFDNEQG